VKKSNLSAVCIAQRAIAHLTTSVALMFCFVPIASAQWFKNSEQSIVADKKSVSDLLRDFAAAQRIDIFIDPAIEGSVSGRFKARPEAFLNALSVSHRFKWYFEGKVLQIVPDSEMATEILALPEGSPNEVRAALARNGLLDPKFPVSISPTDGTLKVSGPRRYVDQIKQAVNTMSESNANGGLSGLGSGSRASVRVFPLAHVWAADTRTGSGNMQTSVPGLATVLKRLFNSDSSSGGSNGVSSDRVRSIASAPRSVPVRGMSGGIPIGADVIEAGKEASALMAASMNRGVSGNSNRQRFPQIEADPRQNAIIIRDAPERLDSYAALIGRLDRPTSLIEIDVKIIEVTTDFVEHLGIDWRFRGSRLDIQRGSTPTLGLPDIAGGIPGGSFTMLAGNALRNFILNVNALVDSGEAKVQASPKILTMANIEALIENRNEFQVKVAGNLEANLFTISAGTLLRVTPMLTTIDREKAIAMTIQVEDGSISERKVEGIPIVTRNAINTQAAVRVGESLLIAGYSRELTNDETSGVPVLSNLPIIGSLFKDTKKRVQKVERYVLITPRTVGQGDGSDLARNEKRK
jgi:type III secretion protein C